MFFSSHRNLESALGDDAALADQVAVSAGRDADIRIVTLAVEGEQIDHAKRVEVVLLILLIVYHYLSIACLYFSVLIIMCNQLHFVPHGMGFGMGFAFNCSPLRKLKL